MILYEFEVVNNATGEHEILIGKCYSKCMAAAGFSERDYTLIGQEYLYEEFDRGFWGVNGYGF